MNDTLLFDKVIAALPDARLVAWDGCHKMYVALDDEQADWFRANYEYCVEGSEPEMLGTLITWWHQSCGLRFISGVTTNHDDPNAGYTDLISQFEGEDEWYDDDDNDEED